MKDPVNATLKPDIRVRVAGYHPGQKFPALFVPLGLCDFIEAARCQDAAADSSTAGEIQRSLDVLNKRYDRYLRHGKTTDTQ